MSKNEKTQKVALISGATGLTGMYLLKIILASDYYQKVKILVRKPIKLSHPKLEHVMYDYENPDTSKIAADDVYCCLGTTIKKAGSKEVFEKVDYHYPLSLAKETLAHGAQNFALVSAMGAEKNSMFFYNQVKGKLEADLQKLPFEYIGIFRPSMLLGKRNEFRFGEELGKIIMKPLQYILPKNIRGIHASKVANAMFFNMQKNNKGVEICLSGAIQKFPELKE